MASVPPPTPPSGAWLPIHRTGDGRAVRRSAAPAAPPASPATAGHTAQTPPWGSYKTSYAVEMVAACFQRDPTDVELVIPVDIRLGPRLKANVITFAFCNVLLSTIYQEVLSLIYVPLVPVVCGVTDSSLVPGPRGM
jgi:hypothetical protein